MCTSPRVAVRLGLRKSDGKQMIRFYRDSSKTLEDLYYYYGKDNVLLLPCGECDECRLKKRKEWSIRCACEAQSHSFNCFVTLTYDDEHLRSLNRADPLKFIKAIRNSGFKVRYFGCGERGSNTLRPHYHIALFGFLPKDLDYSGESDSGEAIYESRFLNDIWKKGHVIVQMFGPGVGGYIAGYTSKKLGDKESFLFMSTKPGLGFDYLQKHKDFAVKYGSIFGDFGYWNKASLPRYFKKILEKEGFGFYLDFLKDENSFKVSTSMYEQARIHNMSRIAEMVFYGGHFAAKKIEKLERGL